eukprot:gene6947-30743_t
MPSRSGYFHISIQSLPFRITMAASLRSVTASQRSAFLGSRPVSARPVPSVLRVPRDRVVAPQALFGGLFGGGKKDDDGAAAPAYHVCIAPKKAFKVYKGTDVKGKINNSGPTMQKRMKEKKW